MNTEEFSYPGSEWDFALLPHIAGLAENGFAYFTMTFVISVIR